MDPQLKKDTKLFSETMSLAGSKTAAHLDEIKDKLLNFVVPLVALLGCALLVALVGYPNFKAIPIETSEIQAAEEKKKVLQNKLALLDKFSTYKSTIEGNEVLLNKALGLKPEEPYVLDEINQLIQSAGLTLNRISTSGGTATTNATTAEKSAPAAYNVVSVSLSASGTVNQFQSFLNSLEGASRVLYVTDYRYESAAIDGKQAPTGIYTYTVYIDSPYTNVKSSAVTDDPITVDLTGDKYLNFLKSLEKLRYYEFTNSGVVAQPAPAPATPAVQGAKTKTR